MGFISSLLGLKEDKVDEPIEEDNDLDLPMDSQEEIDSMIVKSEDYSYEYVKPKVFETIEGSYDKWWRDFKREPKLVVCIGARRKGKDLALHSLSQNIAKDFSEKNGMQVYCIGNDSDDLPNFITSVESIEEVPNDSIVIVGEGGIVSNSRQSMSKGNVGVSKLISVISHKGIYILYASQTGKKLDSNLIAECNAIILLEPSLMMLEMERPVIKRLYKKYQDKIEKYTEEVNGKGVCSIHSKKFKGIVRFKVPKYWSAEISTSYRDTNVLE